MATPESEAFVGSFARGLIVIQALSEVRGAATLATLAEATDIPRTALRRFLLTLVELKMARTDGKKYWLTPRILRLGFSYLHSLPYWREAQLALEDLCAKVHQSCALSVLDEGSIVYLHRQHAKRILPISPTLGSPLPAYCVSMGRCLLSGLTDGELDTYLETVELKRLTHVTIVDRARLRQEILLVRDQGYSWGEREFDESISGLAVPVRDSDGEVVAAINVSLPAAEYGHDDAVAEFLSDLQLTASRIRSSMSFRY